MSDSRLWIFAILLCCIISRAEQDLTYNATIVQQFMLISARDHNLTARCRQALSQVGTFSASGQSGRLRNLFVESYASGSYFDYVGRHRFKWIMRMRECLTSAGDTLYSISENPMLFCRGPTIGHDEDRVSSVCLPGVCDEDHSKLLNEWNIFSNVTDQRIYDHSISCIKSRRQMWTETIAAWSDLLFCLLVLTASGVITIYALLRLDSNERTGKSGSLPLRILMCFSFTVTLPKTCSAPKSKSSTIMCLFGLRVFAMAWVITGHSFAMLQTYLTDVHQYEDDTLVFYNQWLSNCTLSVDLFLVISGTLNAYIWFKMVAKMTLKPRWNSVGFWMFYYVHRVLRLWPAYILVLSNMTFRYSLSSSMPVWDDIDPANQCRKDWWKNLLFINSIFEDHCLPWTWFISMDFIFYAVSPVFLISLLNSSVFGTSLCILILLSSSGLKLHSMLKYKYPPALIGFRDAPPIFSNDFGRHNKGVYLNPLYRVGPYLVGILLGYYLTKIDVSEKLSPLRTTIGWICGLSIGFFAIQGLYPVVWGMNWRIYHLFYGCFFRVFFAISIAWIIYACHAGIGGIVNTFLSCRVFIPISNMGYSIYLLHMLCVVAIFEMYPLPITYHGVLWNFGNITAQFAFSIFLGSLVYLIIEAPCNNLFNILFEQIGPRRKSVVKSDFPQLPKQPI